MSPAAVRSPPYLCAALLLLDFSVTPFFVIVQFVLPHEFPLSSSTPLHQNQLSIFFCRVLQEGCGIGLFFLLREQSGQKSKKIENRGSAVSRSRFKECNFFAHGGIVDLVFFSC
jgi:hypothetical protein